MVVVRAADHQDWLPREKSLLLGLDVGWDVSILEGWDASVLVAWVGQNGMEGELVWQVGSPGRLSCLALSLRSSLGCPERGARPASLEQAAKRWGLRLVVV